MESVPFVGYTKKLKFLGERSVRGVKGKEEVRSRQAWDITTEAYLLVLERLAPLQTQGEFSLEAN